MECLECSRPLRDHQNSDDAPGTRQLHGRGLCRPCHNLLRNAGVLDKLYPARRNEDGKIIRRVILDRAGTTPCPDCKRPMRPYGAKPDEWPGTVCRKGRKCSNCASKSYAPRPKMPADDAVRKMRQDLKDWFDSRGRDWRLAGIPA